MPFYDQLYYRFYDGEAEGFVFPVILLHGAGSALMSWPANLRRLPRQRVFALDLPGHGHSAPPACLSMRCLVRKLHQFIEGMGFYHIALVGFSLGGALALSYASVYPEQVIGIATISCGCQFDIPQEVLGLLRKPADIHKALESFSRAAFHPTFPQAERRTILAPISKIGPDVLLADLSIASDYYFNPQPCLTKIPTLVIGGSNDLITAPASLHRLGRYLSKSTVSILPEVGHMLVYEKDEELKTKVSAFLAKINRPG